MRYSFARFLAAVLALFVGLLIVTWVIADRANPVILDEKGNIRAGQNPR